MTDSEIRDSQPETLLIRGVDIPVQTVTMLQADLRFFVDNPRVYSILRLDGTKPDRHTAKAA